MPDQNHDYEKIATEHNLQVIQQYSADFDAMCQARHVMGADKYGPVKFLETDTLEMMVEEIVDFANYARYLYIKLRILQASAQDIAEIQDGGTAPMLGVEGWKEF